MQNAYRTFLASREHIPAARGKKKEKLNEKERDCTHCSYGFVFIGNVEKNTPKNHVTTLTPPTPVNLVRAH